MKKFILTDYPVFLTWINSYTRDTTKRTYSFALRIFCEWLEKTPSEIIDEAEEEQEHLKMRNRHVVTYLNGFRDHLISRKIAPFTIKTYLSAVKAFYTANYIDIPKVKIEKPVCLPENREIPTKEDMRDVLAVCDPLEKAVILVGLSSGLGAQELCSLKVNDFKKGYDSKTGITQLKMLRIKENVSLVTYLTPEATAAVQNYLKFRARDVQTTNKLRKQQIEKQRVLSDNDFLFCMKCVPDTYLENKDDSTRKLNPSIIMQIYRRVAEKASKTTDSGKRRIIRSHNSRKVFNSTLLNEGCDFFHAEQFLGHTLPSTQENYFRASPDKLKDVYKKYIPYLTIQKELDLSESPEYQAIKSENDILRAETAKHIVERQEITALKNEVERGNIDRAELNELRNEIDSLYREIKGTQEGYKVGTKLVQKIHPNRLILKPDDGSDVEPDY